VQASNEVLQNDQFHPTKFVAHRQRDASLDKSVQEVKDKSAIPSQEKK
jgi:hypothetical protein